MLIWAGQKTGGGVPPLAPGGAYKTLSKYIHTKNKVAKEKLAWYNGYGITV